MRHNAFVSKTGSIQSLPYLQVCSFTKNLFVPYYPRSTYPNQQQGGVKLRKRLPLMTAPSIPLGIVPTLRFWYGFGHAQPGVIKPSTHPLPPVSFYSCLIAGLVSKSFCVIN